MRIPVKLVSLLGTMSLALALLPAPAAGQAAAISQALAGLRAAALRPGSWTYAATVTRGGSSVELARRTLTIAPAEHQGTPAWLILDQTRARGQVMTDSLLVAREDLRPLRRAADMGPMRITLGFTRDSVTGSMTVPGGGETRVALAAPGAAPLVANSGMLEAALTLLPLQAGWRGTVGQLAPSPAGATVVPVTLEVTGEETVSVPAGEFAAWIVTATAGGAEQRLWIAKDGGRLVKQAATPPHASDVSYQTVLVERTPAR